MFDNVEPKHEDNDCINERKLRIDELHDFMFILFGAEDPPDPQVNWKEFLEAMESIVRKEKSQWNPMTKKMAPWVDLKKLNKAYGKGWGWGPSNNSQTRSYYL
jgi:hypothetical protein